MPTFRFSSPRHSATVVEEAVRIPTGTTASEVAGLLATTNHIPCYLRNEFNTVVADFVETETSRYFDDLASSALQKLQSDPAHHKSLIDQWTSAFETEVNQYSRRKTLLDDELLRTIYEDLLAADPSNVSSLLNLEHRFCKEIESILTHRDHEVAILQAEHTELMKQAQVENLNESEISQTVSSLFDRIQLTEAEHNSKLTSLSVEHRSEYAKLLLDLQENRLIHTRSPTRTPRESFLSESERDRSLSVGKVLDESFTIHLGAQMKTMHNVRLMAANPMEMCFRKFNQFERSHRLHMWLSLYGSNLSTIVLLVDSKATYHLDFKTEFTRACEQSPELHFAELETQLLSIQKDAERANKWRYVRSIAGENASQHSGSSPSVTSERKSPSDYESDDTLKTGDVYITKHSNLEAVHVVFHMVQDEMLRSAKDISSRHPCLNGLRNIVRICMRFGISTINVPLLLTYDLPEKATANWCLKRAELVFKCVKGYMIECATLKSGSEQRTVQFILPAEIDSEVFHQIAEMLPTIFRVANAVISVQTAGETRFSLPSI